MEVNGRFQASTALSLDAGVNLPYLVACVFLNRVPRPMAPYRLGVRERWLRGDLMALRDGLSLGRRTSPTRPPSGTVPSRLRIIWRFLRDFAPGTHYDEFKLEDWKPALIECGTLAWLTAAWLIDVLKEPVRRIRRVFNPGARALLSSRVLEAALTVEAVEVARALGGVSLSATVTNLPL
jgi:hypothetical protein